jgi:hypothetical protein
MNFKKKDPSPETLHIESQKEKPIKVSTRLPGVEYFEVDKYRCWYTGQVK